MATAVAAGLVAAYADLRQLQFLLQSLLDALLAQMPSAAAAVLCVPEFVQPLRKVLAAMLMKNCLVHFGKQEGSGNASCFVPLRLRMLYLWSWQAMTMQHVHVGVRMLLTPHRGCPRPSALWKMLIGRNSCSNSAECMQVHHAKQTCEAETLYAF